MPSSVEPRILKLFWNFVKCSLCDYCDSLMRGWICFFKRKCDNTKIWYWINYCDTIWNIFQFIIWFLTFKVRVIFLLLSYASHIAYNSIYCFVFTFSSNNSINRYLKQLFRILNGLIFLCKIVFVLKFCLKLSQVYTYVLSYRIT